MREYCKAAGFYSYDAASEDEDPTKHWIGREVKKFISEAATHISFLLQLAAAPADCIPEMAEFANAAGAQAMESTTRSMRRPPPRSRRRRSRSR